MKITVLYVGSSLLAPLRNAESDINRRYALDLRVTTYNFGATFSNDEWRAIETDLGEADVIFIIHVMDGENGARLLPLLDSLRNQKRPLVVINCMPELMKRARLGKLDFARLPGMSRKEAVTQRDQGEETGAALDSSIPAGKGISLLSTIGSWIGRQARNGGSKKRNSHSRSQYLKFTNRLPSLLRFVPGAGALRDVKNYLMLFCYFLQPSPANIRSMLLFALREYADDRRLAQLEIDLPESLPSVAIYHPDAPALFESFEAYRAWYQKHLSTGRAQSSDVSHELLKPESTIGLLLLRPQIISHARKHYDFLIRTLEEEGLNVIPAISTLMDNREACEKFFLDDSSNPTRTENGELTVEQNLRVSQIVSLTGFSFVGGPAMNDSEAAAEFLSQSQIPLRSMVSLDAQTIESWRESFSGLNPVQTGMQVAIPEIDGATEPFVFGGIPQRGVEPAPLEERCRRIARRLKRWHRLQTAPRDQIKLALALYCFPPNKGNIGTAADLDVFASLFDILGRMRRDGYQVELPATADALRQMILGGNSETLETTANVTYRMSVDEFRRQCPFVEEIEAEWGPAPGSINSFAGELLIQGITLGSVFIGVQPTFGYEDDPMRLLMARSGSAHHGFAAFYTYIEKVFQADAIVHVGTHGALEFMPGKQVGMSDKCWPDRLIGDLPNLYIYSVNNPSEGTIAKRRSYAELISYLTPPIENAGLYKGLASLKDLIGSYRSTTDETDQERLFEMIEQQSRELNLNLS